METKDVETEEEDVEIVETDLRHVRGEIITPKFTEDSGFLPLLEIRGNWKAFFKSGKSQGIWQFFKKSGNFDHPIFFFFIPFHMY